MTDKESIEAFYSGVISCLIVIVNTFDEETLAFEILKGCDDTVVRRIAKREGDDSIVKLVDNFRRFEKEQTRCYRDHRKAHRQDGIVEY